MKTSCVQHPAREPLVIVRQWQVEFCDGNVCAAAVMSFFEYWHNIKLDSSWKAERANEIAVAHGDGPTQDTSLWQFHTLDEIADGIIGMYGRKTVSEAVRLLAEKGVVEVGRNPNPRYQFDKTNYYLFHPETLNDWLEGARPRRPQNGRDDSAVLPDREGKNARRVSKNAPAITETTSQDQLQTTPARSARGEPTRPAQAIQLRIGSVPAKTEPKPPMIVVEDFPPDDDPVEAPQTISRGVEAPQMPFVVSEPTQARKRPSTPFHDVLDAYTDALGYENKNSINFKVEGVAAKRALALGYTPEQIGELTRIKRGEPFWQDKHLSLAVIVRDMPAYLTARSGSARHGRSVVVDKRTGMTAGGYQELRESDIEREYRERQAAESNLSFTPLDISATLQNLFA